LKLIAKRISHVDVVNSRVEAKEKNINIKHSFSYSFQEILPEMTTADPQRRNVGRRRGG
jgi:hypothetical protein